MQVWMRLQSSLIQTCTPNGHLYRVTYTRCIDTINSPDDGHGCPKHVVLFFWRYSPPPPRGGHSHLTHEVSRSHTTTHNSRQDSSGRVISSSQRPIPDNTQHSQQTNIHAPGGMRTHNLNRRAAADQRLRPLDHWDRPSETCREQK